MKHSLEQIRTPSGALRHELRVWGRRDAGDIRKRFKKVTDAQDHLATIIQLERSRPKGESGDPLFTTEHSYWLANKAVTFAPGWKKNVDQYWIEMKGDLEQLKVSQVTKSVLKVIETKCLAKGNSQKTANQKLGFIVAVLNYSVKMDRIKEHKVKNYPFTEAIAGRDAAFWDSEQASSFLKFARDKHDNLTHWWVYCVYYLALNTGLRAGEIWGLQWKALDPKAGLLHVTRQFDMVSKEFRETKGKERRAVPLAKPLYDALKKIDGVHRPEELIFNKKLEPISHRAFAKRFDRDLKEWTGQPVHFHSLRHTAGTLMISKGIDIRTVQEILGHKDISTTMGYVHALKEGIRHVAKNFDLAD